MNKMKERKKLTFGSDGMEWNRMESNGMVANVSRANEIESYLIPLLKRSHFNSSYLATLLDAGCRFAHSHPTNPTQTQPAAN